MNNLFCCLASLLLIGFNSQISAQEPVQIEKKDDALTIMIGIDGLRPLTVTSENTPIMAHLAAAGVRAKGLIGAMPSYTFVNFYSLATGLHPQHHGMVENSPYDRKLGRRFNSSLDAQNSYWWDGEPIWITAEKQGLKSATYFWVGSEAEHEGKRASFWKPYQQSKDYGERVQEVLEWTSLERTKRPDLITLYFSAVDSAAHDFGVNSPEELDALKRIDRHVGDLLAGLAKQGKLKNTNILVVSDHGMIDISDSRMIDLDSIIRISNDLVPDWSQKSRPSYIPFLYLFGEATIMDDAYKKLKNAHPQLQTYKRGEFPPHFQLDHPERGPDIMLLAEPGWTIYASRTAEQSILPLSLARSTKATHGYDTHDPRMHATFIASGPAFKQGIEVPPFYNVEVYGLLACIMGIEPAPNDGDIKHVAHLLKAPCTKR